MQKQVGRRRAGWKRRPRMEGWARVGDGTERRIKTEIQIVDRGRDKNGGLGGEKREKGEIE